MAFRRRSPPKKSFRRRGTAFVTEPRRYQACNFRFTSDLAITNANGTNFAILELATTAHLIGTVGEQSVKGVEIGGIVYAFSYVNMTAVAVVGSIIHSTELWWDRLSSGGAPQYTPSDAYKTNSIVSIAPTVTDASYPTRWIHRNMGSLYPNFADRSGYDGPHNSINKRIKRRIGDREGLYLSASIQGGAEPGIKTVRFDVLGTLYYRWIF